MNSTHNWLITVLRSPYILLVMLIMALWAQFPHPQSVFLNLIPHVNEDSARQSYFYAATMECLIAIFVIYNWHLFSYLFACVSIATNVAYYQQGGIDMFSWGTKNLWVYYLFSIILPVAIAALTYLFADSLAHMTTQAPASGNLWKWLANLQTLKVGVVMELVNKFTDKRPQVMVVDTQAREPDSQVVTVPVLLATPEPKQAGVDKYSPVLAALASMPQGGLAGQLAKMTGVNQSTLFRKTGDKLSGWLVDMTNQGMITCRTEGEKTLYFIKEGFQCSSQKELL